jgi:hypothetical protein
LGCKTPTWLDTIQMEAENMSPEDMVEPLSELEPGEIVVGEIEDDELKKIFGIAMHFREASVETADLAGRVDDPEARQENLIEAIALRKKSRTLMDISWMTVKDRYDLWQKAQVGIRRGWKVVYRTKASDE